MITINNYVKVSSLQEAYELNQKRTNRVLGGMMWLRLGAGRVQTAIDLSGLGLDYIEEDEEEFRIGAMCTLRELELHEGLARYFDGAVKESVRHIVGVQFRNGATVGGSIFGRFGFSDVLTCFLAMDAYVELFRGGIIPLKEFIQMKRDNDILVSIHVKKDQRKVVYMSERAAATDFPLVACAVAIKGEKIFCSVGARPMKAILLEDVCPKKEEAGDFARKSAKAVPFGSNMRAGEAYRRQIAGVLIRRGIEKIMEG
ncbi:FAD binding domain-containing protein [Lachnoclostridium sp. An181]|uniref:FAD binding domain-containing protein n=1 Tax=Lachnoclostridium sp. An181 TaxID=1965575 RepID=UPI000B3ABC61|nr:FAD binding domain-containing protein [Lachnoclostridium sp. An181]OUP51183.1 molybdopterin dehydrogenase [Lachnoclostridium sp. An181]